MTSIRSLANIRRSLIMHQKCIKFGENVASIKNLAERSGVHRDTIYSLLSGNRISEISQIRISNMLEKLAAETRPPSRLMNISLGPDGPKLGFGLGQQDILKAK